MDPRHQGGKGHLLPQIEAVVGRRSVGPQPHPDPLGQQPGEGCDPRCQLGIAPRTVGHRNVMLPVEGDISLRQPDAVGGNDPPVERPDIGQRCAVIGNPYANLPTNGNGQVYFSAQAFAMATVNTTGPNNSVVGPPALGNLGGGSGNLSLPRVTNFDMTLAKVFPLGSEKRILKLQAQAYNVFNHTEINGINTGINFNSTTNAVTNLQTLGYMNGTLANSQRILAFTVRLQF